MTVLEKRGIEPPIFLDAAESHTSRITRRRHASMSLRQRRYPKEEFARRGDEIYDRDIRAGRDGSPRRIRRD
jgi:hypothetical protein